MENDNSAANVDVVNVATPEVLATPSETTTEGQATTEQGNTTVTPQQTQQNVTETQAFSRRFKEGIDAEYSKLYGAEYGIHSKADYDRKIAENQQAEKDAQYQQETGNDPAKQRELFENWKANDPDFKAMKKQNTDNQNVSQFNELISSLEKTGLKDTVKSPNDIPPEVWMKWQGGNSGLSLADSYFLVNKEQIISKSSTTAQQNAVTQMLNNGQSTPGSLSSGSPTQATDVWKMSKDDFKAYQEKALRGDLKK